MRLVIGVVAVSLAACTSVAPDAGQEAVLTRKPILIGSGGVDDTPVKTGRKYVALTTDATYVDMRPKQQEFTFDDLFTLDGVPLDFHASVQYEITDSVRLVRGFGADDGPAGMGFFLRVLDAPFRQIVRDAVKKHGLNEMAINVSAAQSVDDEVTSRFAALITERNVPIRVLSVTLGRANPPDAIKHQRIATAEQEQRVNTERQRKLAEDQRKEAETARAASDNAYREAMRLSPDQFLQLETIKMQHEVCGAGNNPAGGKCTFIFGGGAVPMLPVR